MATAGLSFQLQPYTANNSLRITTASNTGTLAFATPRTADQLNLLVTSANGCTFTATVNFTDGTNQAFTGNAVPNWFFGTTATVAIKQIGRANRTTNAIENPTGDPRLYQYTLTLNAANRTKNIQSISFTKTSTVTNEILHVFAVSAGTVIPNDIGVSAITAPALLVAPNVSQPVTVTVKNYGSSPLSSATLGFSVNGTIVVNNFAFTASPALARDAVSAPVTIGNFSFPAGTHKVKAWTKLPNGIADGGAANDTVLLNVLSCQTLSGNYTIDKNNPASATNFTSFASALQVLNNCGVSGPVTLTVAPNSGPYNEQVTLAAINGISATNTVTFEGSGNTVSASPGTTNQGIFTLDGTDYVKIRNFIITLPAAATTGWAIQLKNNADNNLISNNTINLPLSSSTSSVNGIIASNSNPGSTGTTTSNTTIQNNIINGGYYAISINGATNNTGAVGNLIKGNQIRDAYSYCIALNNVTNTVVEGNDFSRPARTNGSTFYGVYLVGTSTGNKIQKNRIHNSHDVATLKTGSVYGFYTSSPAAVGAENIFSNNLIYNLNNVGGIVYAFYNTGANNTWYFHNTISADIAANTYGTLRGMYFLSSATNVKFINNNFSLTSSATNKHAIYLASTGISLMSNNNNLYVGTNGNIGYYSANKATLADWKAVNNSAYDQASVSVDPVFANPATGNFSPSVVAINNLGQPVPSVTDDINGAVRSSTTPDMGAFEFTVNPNDVGIVAVSGPNATGCGLSASETITVTIKNFGSATQTSVPVSYTINGTGTVNETWTGSIASNATATYTFTAKANLSTSGAYAIAAQTNLTGDSEASNNGSTLNITNSLIPGLPMTFDFETAATGLGRFRKVTNPKSNIVEDVAASNGAGSAKGMIMDGVDNAGWVTPVGLTDPWSSNPDNFSAAYICISPAGGAATDSLWLTFDLKQTFKTSNANTNFRVTVNGTQVGSTYRPPFSGTPINWQKVKVDLYNYRNLPTLMIGLESSAKEAFANGAGTANLIDNVKIVRRVAVTPTGVKENTLASQLHVFPNPSNGSFFVSLENGKDYDLKVTDLTGKVILTQQAKGDTGLKLENAAKGVYLLQVSSGNGTAVRKLIVE